MKKKNDIVFCVPTINCTNETGDAEVSGEFPPTFSLGDKLTSFLPLLEEVFKYLDFQSLTTASEVSPDWDATAKRELKSRNFATWISVGKFNRQCYLRRSADFNYGTASLAILAMCPKIKLDQYSCVHTLCEGCIRMPSQCFKHV